MKEIILMGGEKVMVDDEDFNYLKQWKWHISWNGYAVRCSSAKNVCKTFYMQKEIMKTPKGLYTDHINRNKLDNRKENLRFCNKSQNGFNRGRQINNTSGYKGVTFEKYTNKWATRIKVNGKSKTIGRYNNPLEASIAYEKMAKEVCGEFICV